MNIFISWSGERSRLTAELVKSWVKFVIQSTKPWVSTNDIERGALWGVAIGAQLQESTHGIICLTRENKAAPWILFEAGALAKGLENSRIYTLLIDLEPNEVTGPLAQFNHTRCVREDMQKLVRTINLHSAHKLDNEVLDAAFEAYWPMFEQRFNEIKAQTQDQKAAEPPSNTDLSREILSSLRSIQNRLTHLEMSQPDSDPSNPSEIGRIMMKDPDYAAFMKAMKNHRISQKLPPLPPKAS